MKLSELLTAYFPAGENVLSSRLRLGRTLFINRWHAAVTIGEARNCPEIGARSEQINHAASLAEYIWFFGAFCENDQGTGRVDVNGSPSPSNSGSTVHRYNIQILVDKTMACGRFRKHPCH